MLVCASFTHFCTRDRGCSAHPVFPAPSLGGVTCTIRAQRAAGTRSRIQPSLRAKRSNPFLLCGSMDCFACARNDVERAESVARMERSENPGLAPTLGFPDYASFHPGYAAVIPGRCEASSPESRDSGSGPSDHPGMTASRWCHRCFQRAWPCGLPDHLNHEMFGPCQMALTPVSIEKLEWARCG
jgi:hypothetical protein